MKDVTPAQITNKWKLCHTGLRSSLLTPEIATFKSDLQDRKQTLTD
jgi:hypothetical protein